MMCWEESVEWGTSTTTGTPTPTMFRIASVLPVRPTHHYTLHTHHTYPEFPARVVFSVSMELAMRVQGVEQRFSFAFGADSDDETMDVRRDVPNAVYDDVLLFTRGRVVCVWQTRWKVKTGRHAHAACAVVMRCRRCTFSNPRETLFGVGTCETTTRRGYLNSGMRITKHTHTDEAPIRVPKALHFSLALFVVPYTLSGIFVTNSITHSSSAAMLKNSNRRLAVVRQHLRQEVGPRHA